MLYAHKLQIQRDNISPNKDEITPFALSIKEFDVDLLFCILSMCSIFSLY